MAVLVVVAVTGFTAFGRSACASVALGGGAGSVWDIVAEICNSDEGTGKAATRRNEARSV